MPGQEDKQDGQVQDKQGDVPVSQASVDLVIHSSRVGVSSKEVDRG